jgi:hypothetical protein
MGPLEKIQCDNNFGPLVVCFHPLTLLKLKPMFSPIFQLEFQFHLSSIHDLEHKYVDYIMLTG